MWATPSQTQAPIRATRINSTPSGHVSLSYARDLRQFVVQPRAAAPVGAIVVIEVDLDELGADDGFWEVPVPVKQLMQPRAEQAG